MAKILTGSLVGQGTLLAVAPILTRLYGPSDFAALAAVTAVAAVLGAVVTLSWERAVVIPRGEEQASALVLLGLVTVVGVGTLITAGAYIFRFDLARLLNSEVFSAHWWVLPLTVICVGLFAIASSWVVRHQRYAELGWRNALQGLAQSASSVVAGLFGVGMLGLATSPAVGRIAGLLGMTRGTRLTPTSIRTVRTTAGEFRRFPLINTWSRVINALGLQLPVLLIISLYGSLEAGLYALTLRVLAAPVGIVADAVSQYFEGTFSVAARRGEGGLTRLVDSVTKRLFLVAVVPVVIVALLGPQLFAFVFGDRWNEAGVYAQFLIAAYAMQFIVAPVSRALVILGHQMTQLIWDTCRAVGTVAAVVVAHFLGLQLLGAVCALALVQIVSYVALLFFVRAASKRADGYASSSKDGESA